MCFDDVITQRQPQPRTLPCGLGGKERLEDLFDMGRWDTAAVVFHFNPCLAVMPEGRDMDRWLVARDAELSFFIDGVESIVDEVDLAEALIDMADVGHLIIVKQFFSFFKDRGRLLVVVQCFTVVFQFHVYITDAVQGKANDVYIIDF